MPFVDFSGLDYRSPSPGRTATRVKGTQVQLNHIKFAAGSSSGEHAHPEEQMVYVIAGRFRIASGGEEREVGPGHAVHHLPNVAHVVTALSDGEVISIKAVLPAPAG